MIIGLIGGGIEGLPAGQRYPTLAQGKDTVADYLAPLGFQRVAFADNVKLETAEAYGTTIERLEVRALKETPQEYLALKNCKNSEFVSCALTALGYPAEMGAAELREVLEAPRSPRWTTQLWGTEYRRRMYDPDYWVKQGCAQCRGPGDFLVTDVRMPNEPAALRAIGAYLVRIIRPGTEVEYTGAEHASEISLVDYPVDATLVNRDGDFEGLYRQVDALMARLKLAA